jgi:hypothetical protein
VGTAVGALALAAAVVTAVTLGPGLFSPPADEVTSSAEISSDPDASAADGSAADGSDVAPELAEPTPSPTPTPAPAPTETPDPTPEPTRSPAPSNLTSPAVAPEPAATGSRTPVSSSAPPPAPPTVTPSVPPVEPTDPPVEPEPAPAAPTVIVEQTADQLTFPVFNGTAEPLSTVQILDADGNPLVSTTAAEDGTWSISDFGSSITGDPAGREVVVRQVVDGVESLPSAPTHLVVLEAPAIQNPLNGATIAHGSIYELAVAGAPGASIQRIVNGEPREDIEDIHMLDGDGLWSQFFAAPEAAQIELGMRYYDPATGRYGLTRLITYTIS